MNSNRGLWITLLVLLLIVCCCCCALAWGAGSLALGGIRMGASAVGPDAGGWGRWFRSWNNEWRGRAMAGRLGLSGLQSEAPTHVVHCLPRPKPNSVRVIGESSP